MSTAQLSRARDLPSDEGAGKREIDIEPLLGAWRTFADETTGIARLEIEEGNGALALRALGSGPGDPPDWGATPAHVFAERVDGSEAWGFRASYDLGFERVELFGYLNRGLLAVEAGTTFLGQDGRSDYFTRTFMYRQ